MQLIKNLVCNNKYLLKVKCKAILNKMLLSNINKTNSKTGCIQNNPFKRLLFIFS